MMMAACYANYDMSHQHQQQHALHMHHHQEHHHHHNQQQQQHQSRISSVAAVLAAAAASATIITPSQQTADYNIPLHVDCSVEYELPNQPKPPAGERIEPLLMIHPCYFRKMESQRRSPFINNMPNSSRTNVILNGNTSSSSLSSSRRTTRQSNINQQQQEQQQQQNHRQQQSQRYHSHHLHSNTSQHTSLILGQQIQNQMSQMSQQAHYPIVNSIQQHQPSSSTLDYTDQNIRRNSIIQSRINNNNNSQKLTTTTTNWDKNNNNTTSSVAIVTSLPQQTTGISGVQPVEIVNLNGKSIYSKPVVGKRDAMISGGCISSNNNSNNNNNKLIDQHNNNNININNNTNNNLINRHIKINNNNNSTGCISLSSDITTTNLKLWETSNSLINRSPMATVPSNYQAGPETTSTPINNINNSNNRNDDKINGKYRQYIRSHRNHPYLVTAKTIGHIYPQQLSSSTVTTSFPQLHQMSCYNA